jgi:hypothetical protein
MLTRCQRIAGATNHSIKQWFLAFMVSACAAAAHANVYATREWLRRLRVVDWFAHRPKLFLHKARFERSQTSKSVKNERISGK